MCLLFRPTVEVPEVEDAAVAVLENELHEWECLRKPNVVGKSKTRWRGGSGTVVAV